MLNAEVSGMRFLKVPGSMSCNRGQMRLEDRLKQGNGALRNLRDPRTAHLDAGGGQSLVLAAQRQVIAEITNSMELGTGYSYS